MAKTNRKLIFMSLIALIVLMIPNDARAAEGDVAITARHVAIVFDDSGSMYAKTEGKVNTSWAKANYMMQAFCALLNEGDSLFITYMSDIEGSNNIGNRLEGDRKASVSNIRSWQGDGDTPFSSVETAYQRLKELQAGDSDEYWLVIMTDGDFNDGPKDLNEALEGYIEEMAAENRTLKVVFYSIGEKAKPPTPNEKLGLLVYETDIAGILPTMSDMADNISARQAVESKKIRLIDSKTLTFSTYLPMYSLVLFSQSTENNLLSVVFEDGTTYHTEDSYLLSAPDSFTRSNKRKAVTDKSLQGQVIHINAKDQPVLPAGQYTLTFLEDVDTDNLRILYQSAIAIELRYLFRGSLVKYPENSQQVDAEAILVDASTGEAFNQNVLPVKISCRMQEIVDGKIARTESGFMLRNVQLQSGRTSIVTEAIMPGYGILRKRLNYTEVTQPKATPIPTPDPNAEPFPPIITLMVQGNGRTLPLSKLEQSDPFVVIPLYNKKPVTLNSLRAGNLELTSGRNVNFDIQISQEHNGYLVYPRYEGGALATSTGPMSCNVTYTSEYDTMEATVFSFTVGDMTWMQRNLRNLLFPIIAFVLVVACCGILFLRKRLPKDGFIEYAQYAKNRKDEWVSVLPPAQAYFNNPSGAWRFIPFIPERINVSGLTFLPGKNDQSLLIPRHLLSEGMGTERRGVLDKRSLKGNFTLRSGVVFFVEKERFKITFVYRAPKHSMLRKNSVLAKH